MGGHTVATSIRLRPARTQVGVLARTAAGAGNGSAAEVPTGATSSEDGRPDAAVVAGAFACLTLVGLAVLFFTGSYADPSPPSRPAEGLTIFAVFFVAAMGLERLLEPFALLFGTNTRAALTDAVSDAQNKVDEAHALAVSGQRAAALGTATAAAESALQRAADAKAAHEKAKANRAVGFWALASSAGIAVAAVLKLYLLTTVGVARPGRILDVIATGLIIGAGTKPLHDLVTLISAKKEAATQSQT